jgi:hypothetical protein
MLEFPYETLKFREYTLDLIGNVISGAVSDLGQQQVVNTTGGGYWRLALNGFILRRPEQLRAWRRVQIASQGGVVPFNISLCELRLAPRGAVPHSDGTPFSDGSFYFSGLATQCEFAADAALRATTATVSFGPGQRPVGGELFSVEYGTDHHELHMVTDVDDDVLTFYPPLRAAHVIGENIEFSHPTMTVRLSAVDAMSLTIQHGRFAQPSASLVEYIS